MKGRWIVVDPGFRTILRTRDGNPLTRDQLASPAMFLAATQNIPRYDPSYSFERTTHVRTARLGLIGTLVQKVLDSLLPEWQDSVGISLLMGARVLGVRGRGNHVWNGLLRLTSPWTLQLPTAIWGGRGVGG